MSSVYVPVVVEVAETIIQDVLDDYRVPEEKRGGVHDARARLSCLGALHARPG